MGEVSIDVELREGRGKQVTRKLRARGRIPAVVYGYGIEPQPLTVDPIQLERKIRTSHAGMNTLFDLVGVRSLTGRTALLKNIQRHPVRGVPIHADFYVIDVTQKIQVKVPIHISGSAPGVLSGGVVEHSLREVEIACLPNAIPDEIVADVSQMQVGDSLHVSDLALPEGVELRSDPALSVVSVLIPREEAAPAAPVVTEVIGEKKPEGEETAAAEATEAAKGAKES
ncbi:MAG TPA: 50S ribosomal protein L25 [Planctomycetota bacterium]|nr:50S ribosomal protein L25 [Planctomycetota bacterium]